MKLSAVRCFDWFLRFFVLLLLLAIDFLQRPAAASGVSGFRVRGWVFLGVEGAIEGNWLGQPS